MSESFLRFFGRDECPFRNRCKPANRDAVACNDETVTALECSHDLGIVITQLALRYCALHISSVAQGYAMATGRNQRAPQRGQSSSLGPKHSCGTVLCMNSL